MFDFSFFLPQLLIEPYSLLRCSLLPLFFPSCLFHFPSYYDYLLSLTTPPQSFPLSPHPAAVLLGCPQPGTLLRSAFLLLCISPVKILSGRFSLLCSFIRGDQHPCVVYGRHKAAILLAGWQLKP